MIARGKLMSLSLDILDRLIAFDTVSDRSNLDLIAYVEDFLTSRGFRVRLIRDPHEPKAGLYADIGPEVEGGLLLSAHCDVVPVSGQNWTRSPFRLTQEGELLFGRGTTDMKGFLAEMLAIADQASRRKLKEPLKLVVSYDEEVGCVGIARMQNRLEPFLACPRLAIVGEPTDMQVAVCHKGKRSYRARISGQAGHSALAPRFVSALQVSVDFVLALRALQDDLRNAGARNSDYDIPYSTIHVGLLNSGASLNIVPDTAEALFEFRHLVEDDPDVLEGRIRSVKDEIVAQYRGRSEIKLKSLAAYPGLQISPEHEAVTLVQGWAGSGICNVAFGTEAGFFTGLGIPTVVCGPGSMSGQGHKADEYVSRGQLIACARMLERALETLQST